VMPRVHPAVWAECTEIRNTLRKLSGKKVGELYILLFSLLS